MPVLFAAVPFNAQSIWRFRSSVAAGIVTCAVVNVCYCYLVRSGKNANL